MIIHPKIITFINCIKGSGINIFYGSEKQVLSILKDNSATQTQAVIAIHLGFGINAEDVEKIVFPSKAW